MIRTGLFSVLLILTSSILLARVKNSFLKCIACSSRTNSFLLVIFSEFFTLRGLHLNTMCCSEYSESNGPPDKRACESEYCTSNNTETIIICVHTVQFKYILYEGVEEILPCPILLEIFMQYGVCLYSLDQMRGLLGNSMAFFLENLRGVCIELYASLRSIFHNMFSANIIKTCLYYITIRKKIISKAACLTQECAKK